MLSFVAVALSLLDGFTWAKSSGASRCSFTNVPLGDASINATDPTNKECPSCIMPWVKAPVKTTKYHWRTGDGLDASQDPTAYQPSSVMVLYLRTPKLVDKWAGIHLRAVKASDPTVAVGGWDFPTDEAFKLVEECDGHVLTHSNPKLKLLKQKFFFRTPPKGTGAIRFETLIKQGYQGTGFFYWPEVDLALDEAEPVANALVTARANATESCDTACKVSHSMGCQPTQPDIFQTTNQVCSITFNTCDDAGPGVGDNLVCYACASSPLVSTSPPEPNVPNAFNASNASNASNTFAKLGTACSMAAPTRERLCDCHGKLKPDPKANNAAQQSPPRLMLMLLTLWFSASFARSLTRPVDLHCACSLLVGLLMLQPTSAHNWMNNKGRAPTHFNLGKPPRRKSSQPHVQVNPGQLFQAEWSLGHGGQPDHWFLLMKAEDEGKVPESANKIQEMVSSYLGEYKKHNGKRLDSGPSGLWRKNWIGQKGGCGNNVTDFIKRDPKYMNGYKIKAHLDGPGQHKKYAVQQGEIMPPSKLLADIRVEYTHPDYPFIISGHKFKANDCGGTWNHQIANFEVPENSPPGQYILYYSWNGAYSDILDINVHAKANLIIKDEERYGGDAADIKYEWVRKDHCEFIGFNVAWGNRYEGSKPEYLMTKCEVAKDADGLPNAAACMEACDKKPYGYCSAVAVVRKTNPQGSPESPVAELLPNIPYKNWRNSRPQCKSNFARTLIQNKCDWNNDLCQVQGAADDEYICYGLSPLQIDTFEAYNHVVTDDPMDPKFYSTCFMKEALNHFHPLKNIAEPPPPQWRTGNRCLRCGIVKDFPPTCKKGAVRDWEKHLLPDDQCVDCDGDDLPDDIDEATCW